MVVRTVPPLVPRTSTLYLPGVVEHGPSLGGASVGDRAAGPADDDAQG